MQFLRSSLTRLTVESFLPCEDIALFPEKPAQLLNSGVVLCWFSKLVDGWKLKDTSSIWERLRDNEYFKAPSNFIQSTEGKNRSVIISCVVSNSLEKTYTESLWQITRSGDISDDLEEFGFGCIYFSWLDKIIIHHTYQAFRSIVSVEDECVHRMDC